MRIHEQNKLLKAQLAAALNGIKELQTYLHSDKFGADPMVHKNDILGRIQETKNAIYDLGDVDE